MIGQIDLIIPTMHNFSELIYRCATFTLDTLNELEEKTINSLQTTGATSLVKTLQMIRLEKIILAVGMFSVFEALIQNRLNCNNGFEGAKNILKQNGDLEVLSRIENLELAINALKHGKGRSYNAILAKGVESLKLKVKPSDEQYFDEGDVSEVSTLIDVNNNFIDDCVEVIKLVSKSIEKYCPDVFL